MIANFVTCVTAVATLAACSTELSASKRAFHAAHDAETTVVIGYFVGAKELQFVGGCDASATEDHYAFCSPKADPRASIIIEEIIFGASPGKRLIAHISEFNHGGPFPIGRSKPQLISFKTNEDAFALVDFLPVAKTTTGEWAFPMSNYDTPVLPCDARNMIFSKPIDVKNRLRKNVNDYHAVEVRYLREDPRVEVRGEEVIFKHGLTVRQLKDAIAELRKEERFDKCWKAQTGK